MSVVLDRLTIIPFIADIFARRGAESYLGEAVSMSEHMLQGAMLAEQEGAAEELVVSALLHDIGHYTNEFGPYSPQDTEDNYHDTAGAHVLSSFFPPVVTECVKQHVAAKRYLCAVDDRYFDRLSQASVHTLSLQGGPMNEDEVAAFEANPYLDEIIKVRYWDDDGKVAGVKTKTFADYTDMLQRIVDSHM